MKSAFVPLLSNSGSAKSSPPPSGAKVLPASDARLFSPVQSNAGLHSKGAACGPEAKVTAITEGDRITKLRVQCSCGQVIEIGCVY